MIKRFFSPTPQTHFASTALLVLRLICGLAFVIHGWGKMQNPFAWLPEGAPIQIPGFFQFLAAFAEFAGGIAWILGVITPLASLGLIITMAVAVLVHIIVFKDSFVINEIGSSYESPITYLGIAFTLLAVGPGNFSLDKIIFKEKKTSHQS
ncbi:MAG: DoxX family protein [Bdellovibrionales bacterium]|nr:DoxX family protein [Bdellovibrionales bacterium]